ncbi:MAG: hypothetical protein ACE5HV_03300 [Acidobacteriota bacterium]
MVTGTERHILIVCHGNLCRSPMAEVLLQAQLPANEWRVSSSGTHAIGDDPPAPEAQRVVAEMVGLDISSLRSTPVTVEDLRRSDHILTMSRLQAAEVVALAPEVAERTRLLGGFAPAAEETELAADPRAGNAHAEEIGDPLGGEPETYRQCCDRLLRATGAVARWLSRGAEEEAAPPAARSWLQQKGDAPLVVIRYRP